MKPIIIVAFVLGAFSCYGSDSKSVNMDKKASLSEYFKKINKKVVKEVGSEAQKKDEDTKDLLAEADILLDQSSKKDKSPSSISHMNKMIFSVLIILCMGGVSLLAVRKWGKSKGYSAITRNITILAQKPVGPKKNLMLIRIAGETILLGVTDYNINPIKTLSLMDDELPDYTEPHFSHQLKEKIDETNEYPTQLEKEREKEAIDGFTISQIDDVRQAVSRYSS